MRASPSKFAPKNSGSREQKPVAPRRIIGAPSARPQMKSEAQRLLWEVTDSLSTIAKKVGAGGKPTVAHWRSGLRKPDEAKRKKLAKVYGIPAQAWEQRVNGAELDDDDDNDAQADDQADEIEEEPFCLASPEHSLELIQEARKLRMSRRLSPSERLKTMIAESSLLEKYRLTQERERHVEEMIVRTHPHWQRFEDLLLKALHPFPEAMRAVVEAIEKAGL